MKNAMKAKRINTNSKTLPVLWVGESAFGAKLLILNPWRGRKAEQLRLRRG